MRRLRNRDTLRRMPDETWPDETVELTDLAKDAEKLTDDLVQRIVFVDRDELFDLIVDSLNEAHDGKNAEGNDGTE